LTISQATQVDTATWLDAKMAGPHAILGNSSVSNWQAKKGGFYDPEDHCVPLA